MSNLTNHAEKELELAGLFKKDSDYGGMLGQNVMELVKVFSKQEHSGFSANMAIALFERVARFEPLAPLTGEDDEWVEVEPGVFQNKRCSHVFKKNGQAYNIYGKVFREPSGATYTSGDSHVPVVFPCIPKTEYVDAK